MQNDIIRFHRFFSAARWYIDHTGLAVFDLITTSLKSVFLPVDDTLLPRSELKVFGMGIMCGCGTSHATCNRITADHA